MPLLRRYIGVTLGRTILLALLGLTLLIMVFAFIEEVDSVGKGTFGALDALIVALAATPRFLYEAFPIAALLGALIGMGGLARRGELVAMRGAGLSQSSILGSVLRTGLVFAVLVLLIGELVAPHTEQFGHQYRLEKQQRKISFRSANGFWAKDGNAFVNVRGIEPSGELRSIRIYELTENRELRLLTSAGKAKPAGQGYQLEGISQAQISPEGIQSRTLARAKWESFLDPELLRVIIVDPLMLPLWELQRYTERMRENRQEAESYAVAFWSKIATPFLTLGMLALSVPLAMQQGRAGAGQRVLTGALVGAGFYVVNRGFSLLTLVYDLPAFLVALLPAATLLLVLGILLRRAR